METSYKLLISITRIRIEIISDIMLDIRFYKTTEQTMRLADRQRTRMTGRTTGWTNGTGGRTEDDNHGTDDATDGRTARV